MADDITTRLFKLKKWKVVNSPSAMFYKETEKTYKEIGKELAVTHILTGTIREEREKIRITARLIRVKDNSIVWSDTYDEELQSVFDIQSSIARNVASAIRKELSPEEKLLLEKKTTENLKAYELYTLGRYHWNKRTFDDFTQSIEYYQKAIDLDPEYALAYAGIAESYVLMKEFTFGSIPPQVFFQKAREAAMKALELDDSLAGAYTALGYIKFWDWDFEGTEKDYKKAIELNPSYATAHHWYAELLCWQARLDDALDEILLAQKLDPMSKVISVNVGRIHLYRREFDLALEALQSTKKMDPEWGVLTFFLGQAYFYNSMYEEALAEFDKTNKWVLENIFSTEAFGELIKYLLKNTDALKQCKKILESAGEDMGSLDEFRNQLEYLTVNPDALSAKAKDLIHVFGEDFKSYLHGLVYAKMGKEEEVEQILEMTIEFGKMGYAQQDYDLAVLYFLLGKDDLGFMHLDKAIENKQAGYDLKVDPLFDDVRSDPRFQALLKKMGLD
ncbi:MAG: FlgO family outer membrane protein [Candidatus Hodarchaeota archaeon]